MYEDQVRCCVVGCDSTKKKHPQVPFHLFPRENHATVNITNKLGIEVKMDRKLAWEYLLLRGSPAGSNDRVCARHFTVSDYFPRRNGILKGVKSGSHLKMIAVPSQNLPSDEYLQKDFLERFHSDIRCRVCKKRTFKVRSVFEPECFTRELSGIDKAIMACANVQVEKEDGLPQFICSQCVDSLHEVFKFRELCERTDAELRWFSNEKQVDGEEILVVVQDPLKDKEEVEDTVLKAIAVDQDDEDIMYVFDVEQMVAGDELSDDNSTNFFHDSETLAILCWEEHNYAQACDQMEDEPKLLSPEDIKEEIEDVDIKLETCSVNSEDETQGEQMDIEKVAVKLEISSDSSDEAENLADQDILFERCDEVLDDNEAEPNQYVEINNGPLNEVEANRSSESTDPLKLVKPRKKYNTRNRYKTENSYKCGLCGYVSQISHLFKKHQALHYNTDGNQRLRCKICSKPFPDKGYLNHHLRIHFRINQCEFCQKHFPSHPKLLAHKRRHLGEEPYECSVCNMRFGVFQALADHKHIHTDQLTFECNVCGKRFKLRDTMLSHRKVHENERLFRCSVCKRAFAFKDKFRMHLLMHHRLDNFKAPEKIKRCFEEYC